jgi:uncharacterized protein with FMN-binding domain
VLAFAALAGGLVLTQHYSGGSSSGSFSTSPSTSSSPSAAPTTGNTKPDKTVTSASVPYQFGVVQLTVTRTAGKIAKIDYGNSGATNGRASAFPYLVQYALKSQGTNFSNISGATYTTNAFKQALCSAITKLG